MICFDNMCSIMLAVMCESCVCGVQLSMGRQGSAFTIDSKILSCSKSQIPNPLLRLCRRISGLLEWRDNQAAFLSNNHSNNHASLTSNANAAVPAPREQHNLDEGRIGDRADANAVSTMMAAAIDESHPPLQLSRPPLAPCDRPGRQHISYGILVMAY